MGRVPWLLLCLACRLWAADTLNLYFIDTDGGHAALVVAPSGASLLIDTGNEGYGGRDATRIRAAAKDAGVKKLDYLLLTGFDRGHASGLANLLSVLPVGTFLDAGAGPEGYTEAYQGAIANAKHQVLAAGDAIPMKGIGVRVEDAAKSVWVEFGKFRLAEQGYVSLVYDGTTARLAILNNGARAGTDTAGWKKIRADRNIEDLWQVHFALENGGEANAPDALIANLREVGDGNFLKLAALADGSFTVLNPRNKYSKKYGVR